MNTFIEKNKKLFKFYYAAIRLSGWLLLSLGICSFVIKVTLANVLGIVALKLITLNTELKSFELILFGLLGLGIAQLIRYLIDGNYKAGFILRHGGMLLYTYVILIFFTAVLRNVFTIGHFNDSTLENAQAIYFVTSATSLVLFAAKALVLIGLAQFLKRIMPVIEEHKSLV